jgi:hypothetical protein
MRCPNKSANGNRLGQNDPHPPAIDDKDLTGVLRVGLSELLIFDCRDYHQLFPFYSIGGT